MMFQFSKKYSIFLGGEKRYIESAFSLFIKTFVLFQFAWSFLNLNRSNAINFIMDLLRKVKTFRMIYMFLIIILNLS